MPRKPSAAVPPLVPPRPGVTLDEPSGPRGGTGLVVIVGRQLGRLFVLEVGETTIGRAAGCGIVFDEDSVSKHHCTVRTDGRRLWARDTGSSGGTYVDGVKIREEVELVDGSRIQIGGALMLRAIVVRDEQALESAYHEELYRLATTDALTDVFNERYLVETLHREVARARKYERALALVLLDVDRMRDHDEVLGRHGGDELLRCVAALLREHAADEHVVGRMRGDVFAVLMPDTDLPTATDHAESLRATIERTTFTIREHCVDLTVSAGVVTLQPDDLDALALLRRAESALLGAGRHRIVSG